MVTIDSKKMFSNWSISFKLITIIFVTILAKTTNGSPAPPFPPVMTSHTEILDLSHLKMLPAGTYPDYATAALVNAAAEEPELNHENFNDLVKRSWQNLQGSWGKRSNNGNNLIHDYNTNLENYNDDNNLLSISKEEELLNDNIPDYEDLLKYSEIYRVAPETNNLFVHDDLKSILSSAGGGINENKRAWKNMNVAWGKRRTNDWNKFRGSWGKREPSWNNLKGLWGKRSGDWNKLKAAWGKRSTSNIPASTTSNDITQN